MFPNFPPVLPSFSQPPRFQSIDHHDHSSPSCESELRPLVSLGASSNYTHNQSQTNTSLSQPSNGGSSDDENDEDDKNESSSENHIEIAAENGEVRIKRNMKAKDVLKLQEGEKVVVHVNECGQPIEVARRVLTRWMTELVKQPNLCPPDVKDFHELKKICGCHLLRLVREKFTFPNHDNVDHVLMSMFNAKFRNNKYKIAKKLYKDAEASYRKRIEQDLVSGGYPKEEIDEALGKLQYESEELEKEFDKLPPLRGFAPHQWFKLLKHIKSPEFKRFSSHGKAARNKHSHAHTTGTTSFAPKKVEFIKNKKRKPGYIEFFYFTHMKKDGTYAKDKSALFMEYAKNKMEEYKASGKFPNDYVVQREAWEFFMGEDAPGRARGFGVGVTKSQVRGFRAELMEMRNEGVAFDHSRFIKAKVQKEIDAYKADTDATIKAMQAELQLYRTAYLSGVDPMSQAYGQTHGGIGLQNQQATNQGQKNDENGSCD